MEEFSPGESGRVVFIVMLDLFLGDFRWQEVKVLKKKDASFTDGLGFDLFGKAWQVLVREELDWWLKGFEMFEEEVDWVLAQESARARTVSNAN